MVLEEITISLRLIWAGVSEGLKNAGDSIDQFKNRITTLNAPFGQVTDAQQKTIDGMKQFGIPAKELKKRMEDSHLSLTKEGVVLDENTGLLYAGDEATKKLQQSTRRFRMEYLSLMFFGMAINRFFKSLTKGALEAAGAMKVWSVMTLLLGLPAAVQLTRGLLWLLQTYLALPDSVKTVLSWVLYLGMAFGTLLGAIFAVKLGMAGWTMLTGGVGVILGTILALLVVVIALGYAIYLIIDLYKSWKENTLTVKKALEDMIGIITALMVAFLLLGITIWAAVLPLVPILAAVLAIAAVVYLIATYWDQIVGFVEKFISLVSGKGWTAPTKTAITAPPTAASLTATGPASAAELEKLYGPGAAGSTFSPTYNISDVKLSNDLSIEQLSKKLNDMLYTDMKRRAT